MHTGDKGQPREELQGIEEFSGIDFSLLEDDWTSKKGDFGTGVTYERAKWVRKWLRARPEKEIVGEYRSSAIDIFVQTS